MKQNTNVNTEKEKLWAAKLALASEFGGTAAEFCRQHNLRENQFSYWRTKLASKSRLPEPIAKAFIPVEVCASPKAKRSLPDPRWLAELILNLER